MCVTLIKKKIVDHCINLYNVQYKHIHVYSTHKCMYTGVAMSICFITSFYCESEKSI